MKKVFIAAALAMVATAGVSANADAASRKPAKTCWVDQGWGFYSNNCASSMSYQYTQTQRTHVRPPSSRNPTKPVASVTNVRQEITDAVGGGGGGGGGGR
jgi:hypothetical protein